MTSQYRCRKCLTYFEQIRWDEGDRDDPQPGPAEAGGKEQGR